MYVEVLLICRAREWVVGWSVPGAGAGRMHLHLRLTFIYIY